MLYEPNSECDITVAITYNVCTKIHHSTVYSNIAKARVPRGGGTPLNGLYRYVPRNRVWFLEVLDP